MDLKTFLRLDTRGAVEANIRYIRRAESLRLVGDKDLLPVFYREYSMALKDYSVDLPDIEALYLPSYQFSKNPFARHDEAVALQEEVKAKLEELGTLFGCYIKTPNLLVVDLDLKPSGEKWEKLLEIVWGSRVGGGLTRKDVEKLLLLGLASLLAGSVKRAFPDLQVYVSARGFHVPVVSKDMVYASASFEVDGATLGRLVSESVKRVAGVGDEAVVAEAFSGMVKGVVEVIPGYSKVLPYYDLVLQGIMLPWIKCVRSLSRATTAEEFASKVASLALVALAGAEAGDEATAREALGELHTAPEYIDRLAGGFKPFDGFTRMLSSGGDPVKTVRKTLADLVAHLTGRGGLGVRVEVVDDWSPLGLRAVSTSTIASVLVARAKVEGACQSVKFRPVVVTGARVTDLLRSFAREKGFKCLEAIVDGAVRKGYRFRALCLLLDIIYLAQVELNREDLVSLCRGFDKWEDSDEWAEECLKKHILYIVRQHGENSFMPRYPYFGVKLAREATGAVVSGNQNPLTLPRVAEQYVGVGPSSLCAVCRHGGAGKRCPIRYYDVRKALKYIASRLHDYMVARELRRRIVWPR